LLRQGGAEVVRDFRGLERARGSSRPQGLRMMIVGITTAPYRVKLAQVENSGSRR